MYEIREHSFIANGIISSVEERRYRSSVFLDDTNIELLLHHIRAILIHKDMEGQFIKISVEAINQEYQT